MFAHEVTEIKTKKLSILLSFYFHEVLQHLKTFIYTNFRFQGVLCFAIEDTWISNLVRDATSYVSVTDFLRFCYLNNPYLRINITLIFMSSSSDELTSKTQKRMFLLVSDIHICAPQRDTTNLGFSIQSLKNLGETFFEYLTYVLSHRPDSWRG